MTELRFDDRVVIVTGAGGGLGGAYARLLASRGAKVVANDLAVTDDDGRTPAARLVAQIAGDGGEAVAVDSSVAEPGAGEAIVQAALDAFGRVDVVINNAGFVQDRSFAKMTQEDLDAILDVHYYGPYHLTKAAWPHLREQQYGRVVFTTSVAGLYGNFGQANYSSGKAAVIGLGRTLAIEGARSGIRVNLVSPGAATAMTAAVVPEHLHAAMSPERVAPMVAYLAHETCAVTGEIFHAVGGHYARNFIAVTSGYRNPDASIEDIADHLGQITDLSDWEIPGQAIELPE
ncbi:SDR family NAD(P)-dependent oxidoreductase [Microbacterium sp.]|uniref:SDR family NAD(P)-dependent oxidoreductase n=1 Tax=Microbacterium sp. TaxID=51671 RepID=UPI0037C85E9A